MLLELHVDKYMRDSYANVSAARKACFIHKWLGDNASLSEGNLFSSFPTPQQNKCRRIKVKDKSWTEIPTNFCTHTINQQWKLLLQRKHPASAHWQQHGNVTPRIQNSPRARGSSCNSLEGAEKITAIYGLISNSQTIWKRISTSEGKTCSLVKKGPISRFHQSTNNGSPQSQRAPKKCWSVWGSRSLNHRRRLELLNVKEKDRGDIRGGVINIFKQEAPGIQEERVIDVVHILGRYALDWRSKKRKKDRYIHRCKHSCTASICENITK